MKDLAQLLPLVRTLDENAFAQQIKGFYLVRQKGLEKGLEVIDGGTNFIKTPVQVPIVDPNAITPSSAPSAGSTDRVLRALILRTEQDILDNFAVHPIEKSGRNSFQAGMTLGRAGNNDIVIPVKTVSKFHAWLAPSVLGKFYCYDADSSYGTYVDHIQLMRQERRVLDLNSRLRVGDANLTLVDSAGLYRWVQARLALMKR